MHTENEGELTYNTEQSQAMVFDDSQQETTVIEKRRLENRQLYSCCCKSYLDFNM
jgi:hypothetical protein